VKADQVKSLRTLQLDTLEQLTECVVSVITTSSNEKYINKCVPPPPNDFGECGKRDRWLCSLYKGTPLSGNYANPHCLKCSSNSSIGIHTSQLKCPSRCFVDKWCSLPGAKDLSKYPYVFHLTNDMRESNFTVVSNYHQNFPITTKTFQSGSFLRSH